MRRPILMNAQDVEPIILTLLRPIHPNAIRSQLVMHALILDVAHAVERDFGITLLQQHRPDTDAYVRETAGVRSLLAGFGRNVVVRGKLDFAKVVDEARDGEDIQSGQGSLGADALRVVMVAVDGEDGDADVEVGVFVVDGGEAGRGWARTR